jgi:hypothetical protein
MGSISKDGYFTFPRPNAETTPPWWGAALRLKHLLGIDRAIAFTILARAVQILGSTGTVLLIFRFLTPVEQGYYYTLLSLVSLQTVFELGFSFVILQMAAHECAHLTLHPDGRVEGGPVAHARLASILQKTFRWYLVAAIALCVALLLLGGFFFSRHTHTAAPVAWQNPWTLAVFATAFLFLLNPFFSFLEGCGQVWQVGRMRFAQSLLGAAMSWGALLAHHGLYSPGMVNIGYASAGLGFIYSRRNLCLGLLRFPARAQVVSWRREIWPFQWKIAVSWISAYFSFAVFTPILFVYRGPAEAGQFGMSLSITAYLSTLALAWMSTKATPFGQMTARGEFQQLRRMFFRTLRQALSLLVVGAAVCEVAAVTLQHFFPRLAVRMAAPSLFALLLLTCVSGFVVQCMAIYLRSFKREPFLAQSAVVALSTGILAPLAARTWGVAGVTFGYFVCTGIIGLAYGIVVFRRHRPGSASRIDVRRYSRRGVAEIARHLFRGVDFLVLLAALRLRGRLAPFRSLKTLAFVELGPGPMRIASLKRILFREVYFVDQSDFGIPHPQLRLVDLEACRDVKTISELCGLSADAEGLFLFADHCIEHLSPAAVLELVRSTADRSLTACFRVPNIESPSGRRNFDADPTHHSPFDRAFRRSLAGLGFAVYPWVRWYRFRTLLKLLIGRLPLMGAAEEIVVAAKSS